MTNSVGMYCPFKNNNTVHWLNYSPRGLMLVMSIAAASPFILSETLTLSFMPVQTALIAQRPSGASGSTGAQSSAHLPPLDQTIEPTHT